MLAGLDQNDQKGHFDRGSAILRLLISANDQKWPKNYTKSGHDPSLP